MRGWENVVLGTAVAIDLIVTGMPHCKNEALANALSEEKKNA
jgi:hypothetical protein